MLFLLVQVVSVNATNDPDLFKAAVVSLHTCSLLAHSL